MRTQQVLRGLAELIGDCRGKYGEGELGEAPRCRPHFPGKIPFGPSYAVHNYAHASDSALGFYGAACRYLTKVDLSYQPSVSGRGLKALFDGARFINHLALNSCPSMGDEMMFYLTQADCASLNAIEMEDVCISDSTLALIAAACPNLSLINISFPAEGRPDRITDRGVKLLAAGCSSLNVLNVGCRGHITFGTSQQPFPRPCARFSHSHTSVASWH